MLRGYNHLKVKKKNTILGDFFFEDAFYLRNK